jgi:metallo-beta-lactamase class B
MQHLKRRPVFSLSSIVFLLLAAVQGLAQQLPKGVTPEDLATNNKLFIELAKKAFRWEEPTDPVRIAGPIYFVGTKDSGPF